MSKLVGAPSLPKRAAWLEWPPRCLAPVVAVPDYARDMSVTSVSDGLSAVSAVSAWAPSGASHRGFAGRPSRPCPVEAAR